MKKTIAFILIAVLIASVCSGCIRVRPNDFSSLLDSANDLMNDVNDLLDQELNQTDSAEKELPVIEETVVYDMNDIKITVTGLQKGFIGPEIKLLVENNTSEDISFLIDEVVVNGITVTSSMFVDVAAGKKANDTITIYSSKLKAAGIDTLATIRVVGGAIIDADGYSTLYKIPDFTVETSAAASYEQKIDENGPCIYNDAGIKVIVKEMVEDDYDQVVYLLVKNETGKNIIVNAEDVSVNGFMIGAFLYETVCNDSVRYCELELMNSDLEENDITSIDEVTFSLEFVDADTYKTIATMDESTISFD